MKIAELLARLHSLGVKIRAAGGELKLSAPKGVMTPELREELAAHKEEILAVLDFASSAGDQEVQVVRPGYAAPIRRVSRDEMLPLSFAQPRLWFLPQLEPDMAAYNLPLGWRLKGELDVRILERCLSEILRRHEALRTTFPEVAGVSTQAIADPSPL